MKFLKRICSRLNRFLSPQPGKNGSSMAFVMIIGAVLVIWVLAIMPLMVAVGNNSLTLQGSYADYLQSRSAIEFCKGELEKMVETDPPRTFAVIKTGNTYSVAYKRVDGKNVDTTQPTSYGNLINYSGDDKTDTPKDNSVVAICAVVKDPDKSEYNITITTYNDGKPGLTYSTVYTIRGTLKINPESYLQSQALPLSDFVVVDGKLGGSTLWNSTIHSLSFSTSESNNVTNLGAIQENLLPYSSIYFPGDNYDYADAGPFPAVFKTTVFPAKDDRPAGGNTSNGTFTSNGWTRLNPVSSKSTSEKKGDVWYEITWKGAPYFNYVISIYINNGSKVDITDKCTIYLNGERHINGRDNNLPTKGIYTVSIDFGGYGNFLPVTGLQLTDPYDPEKYLSSKFDIVSYTKKDFLTNGQKYLIVDGNGRAIYADGYEIKVDNIDTKSQQDDMYFWTYVKEDGNTYLIGSNDKYLYITNNSASLSDESVYISIEDGIRLKKSSSNRYLYLDSGSVKVARNKNYNFTFYTQTEKPEHTFDHGTTIKDICSSIGLTDPKINDNSRNESDILNPGIYLLTGKLDGKDYKAKLTISKKDCACKNTLSTDIVTNANDVHEFTVTVRGTTDDCGHLYIGYKLKSAKDYDWFPANNGNSFTFRLNYGNYDIAVCESGTNYYNEVIKSTGKSIKRDDGKTFENDHQSSIMMGSSLYFMGRNGSIQPKGNTIYLYTDLIVLRHDIDGTGSVIINPYSLEPNTYDPNDTAPDTLLFAVNDIKNASGKVVFEALTFYRIPAGKDINNITASEASNLYHQCIVNYNKGEDEQKDKEFDSKFDKLKLILRSEDYPEINMDIAYIDRENNADKVDAETGKPSNEQLAHIISGETIDWLDDGVMHNRNDKNYGNKYHQNDIYDSMNRQFVVCAYIVEVNDVSIDRTANRILIASALQDDGTNKQTRVLTVPNHLSFTCRYFSVYADKITQGQSGSMTIKSLGRDPDLINTFKKILGLSSYFSRSLQVDFELFTTIQPYNSSPTEPIPAQIYRIDADSWDVFSKFNQDTSLMVQYTHDEIRKALNGASNEIDIVDRYISLTPNGVNALKMDSWGSNKLNIYSNYIYIDSGITGYSFRYELMTALISSCDLIINSQERGYKSEYINFFYANSAETYTGTIIYIKDGITITKYYTFLGIGAEWATESFQIPAGFYFIPATPDGTSIAKLTDLGAENNTEKKPWAIDPEDLDDYSIYIKEDGTMSNAYVDTGLIGNGDLGESGFSGGNLG